jgi:hypothetical protein
MRGKLLLTFLVGLVVGVVFFVVAGRQPQAAAQRPEGPPQWEYKVVTFPTVVKEADKQLNQLADDRWEYVGLISTSTAGASPAGGFSSQGALVAFRRPKK